MKNNNLKILIDAINESMSLSKCKKCACMKKSLESMESSLSQSNDFYNELLHEIEIAISKTEKSEYT